MKLKAVIFALTLTFVSSAFAQWFVQPQMFVNSGVTVARIHNTWGRAIICQGEVNGLTSNGLWLRAAFNDVVPMGQYREAFVYTNPYDPFVDARSNIWCNFL